VFRAGHEDVSLHPLQVGSRVIAGTVIGHLGAASAEAVAAPVVAPASAGAGETNAAAAAGSTVPGSAAPSSAASGAPTVSGPQARMIFQIRPNGVGAPLIDPKPILDGWVRLEGSLIYRATGTHRFPSAPPAIVRGAQLPPKGAARLATVLTPALTPGQWLALTAHLGAIPDPVVAGGHSAAAIPIAKGRGSGNH
jgi:hypothetical protein